MTLYYRHDDLEWTDADVRGAVMSKSAIFEGDYGVRSAFFKLPKGMAIGPHHHADWVQVAVLDGRMRIEQDGEPAQEISAGGVYFVTAGETHDEIALENVLVLVTQGEDRPGKTG